MCTVRFIPRSFPDRLAPYVDQSRRILETEAAGASCKATNDTSRRSPRPIHVRRPKLKSSNYVVDRTRSRSSVLIEAVETFARASKSISQLFILQECFARGQIVGSAFSTFSRRFRETLPRRRIAGKFRRTSSGEACFSLLYRKQSILAFRVVK